MGVAAAAGGGVVPGAVGAVGEVVGGGGAAGMGRGSAAGAVVFVVWVGHCVVWRVGDASRGGGGGMRWNWGTLTAARVGSRGGAGCLEWFDVEHLAGFLARVNQHDVSILSFISVIHAFA